MPNGRPPVTHGVIVHRGDRKPPVEHGWLKVGRDEGRRAVAQAGRRGVRCCRGSGAAQRGASERSRPSPPPCACPARAPAPARARAHVLLRGRVLACDVGPPAGMCASLQVADPRRNDGTTMWVVSAPCCRERVCVRVPVPRARACPAPVTRHCCCAGVHPAGPKPSARSKRQTRSLTPRCCSPPPPG
jgi:hypothetical protein